MAHKTRIDGTYYEISGGRTLVNGTGYSIDKGKTLVGGTVYEVGFGKMVTVTLIMKQSSISASTGVATAKIDGTTYMKNLGDNDGDGNMLIDTVTLQIPTGTLIELSSTRTDMYYGDNYIMLNGDYIGRQQSVITYTHTVTENVTITLNCQYGSIGQGMYASAGQIEITEIPEGHALVTIYATGTGVGMGCYLTIDGVKYGTALSTDSYVFPVGTVIACYAKTDSEDLSDSNPDYGYHSKYGNIRVNGEYVAWATEDDHDATYDYIVTENAYIELVNSKGLGRVVITEQ